MAWGTCAVWGTGMGYGVPVQYGVQVWGMGYMYDMDGMEYMCMCTPSVLSSSVHWSLAGRGGASAGPLEACTPSIHHPWQPLFSQSTE